ncbi:hypothetical protein [Nocardia aurantia]|nr:hypothetical protein [Nocardia aurantia]
MFVRTFSVAGMICAATVLISAPAAVADSGSSSLSGPSSLSGQINLGCLIETFSAQSPSASCHPPSIPVAATGEGERELSLP